MYFFLHAYSVYRFGVHHPMIGSYPFYILFSTLSYLISSYQCSSVWSNSPFSLFHFLAFFISSLLLLVVLILVHYHFLHDHLYLYLIGLLNCCPLGLLDSSPLLSLIGLEHQLPCHVLSHGFNFWPLAPSSPLGHYHSFALRSISSYGVTMMNQSLS